MPKSPDQLVDQTIRHAVYLERYKSSAVKEYIPLMEKMEKAIRAELSMDITDWNRKRLEKQLNSIEGAIANVTEDVSKLANGQFFDLAKYEVEFEAKSIGNVISGYDFDLPSDSQIKAAVMSAPLEVQGPYQGQLLESFVEGWSNRTIQKVDGAIRLGYVRGQTTQQIVRDLFSMGGPLANSRKDLEGIVRTGLAHTAQVARQELWKKNTSVVKGYRISATLDSRTTPICRSLDGQIYPINKGPKPPFHIRCRTTTTAALDNRLKFLNEGATRSARDPETGKVEHISANTTYYGWLKSQPAAVQDSIVGPTRGKLLRNGGLTAERFAELNIGKNFEPLTLKEMKQLEPLAFEKANIQL